MKTRFLLLAMIVLFIGGILAPSAYTMAPSLVTICHLTGTGEFITIHVAEASVDSHLAHGDKDKFTVDAAPNKTDNCPTESLGPNKP